jgi:hypothetical protein
LNISYTTFTMGMISIGLWLGCQPWVSLDYIESFESYYGVKMLIYIYLPYAME